LRVWVFHPVDKREISLQISGSRQDTCDASTKVLQVVVLVSKRALIVFKGSIWSLMIFFKH
jgi:hypothetical protein